MRKRLSNKRVGREWDKKFEGFDARQTLHVRQLLRQQIYIML